MLVLWATPRSTSTAFEWMMRQRGDFTCFHEPFNEAYYYGSDRRSQRDADVPDTEGLSFSAVWSSLTEADAMNPVFVKDFAYSVEHDLNDARLAGITSTFLLRDPRRVIQGLANYWPDCTREEVGFVALHRLFHRVADRDGVAPPVLLSADLLDRPAQATRAFCHAVGIDFRPDALEWDAGDRREVSWYGEGTGPWHDTLRESTGIQKPRTTYPPLEETPRLVELYEEALLLYEDLLAHALPVEGAT
jgi:hypothetical protein